MNKQELKRQLKLIKKFSKKVTESKEAAEEFLRKIKLI